MLIFKNCHEGIKKIKHWQADPETQSWLDCPRCTGTGEGDWGLFCSICGGKGETGKEKEWDDYDGDERRAYD